MPSPRPTGLQCATLASRNLTSAQSTSYSRHLSASLPTAAACYRKYHQPGVRQPPCYSDKESSILSAAYQHVPSVGFHRDALVRGAQDAGYVPASVSIFPRGAFELVLYHLTMRRLDLHKRVQDHPNQFQYADGTPFGPGSKIRALVKLRLRANAPVISRYQEAIALMSLAENIPKSLSQLSQLSDDLWYLSGNTSVDGSWYTKRSLLAAVYASSEIYMTQDTSEGFRDTEQFVDRRLHDVQTLGSGASSTAEWLKFTGLSTVNVLRSLGAKI